jgi:hypothetical protein
MPFWGLRDETLPQLNLREDDDDPKLFHILRGFRYKNPRKPEIYVIPGVRTQQEADEVIREKLHGVDTKVFKPAGDGSTDLASVPSFLWWLVASYGDHTRAALLHDALIPNGNQTAILPRKKADRLLLTAIRERPANVTSHTRVSWIRPWLMWAAVTIFGTYKAAATIIVPLLIALSAFLFWGLVALDLLHLLDADRFTNWLGGLVHLTPTGRDLYIATAVLGLAGFLWGLGVDLALIPWLWPLTVFGLLIVAPPVVL